MNILRLIFMLFFFVHLFACIWFQVVQYESKFVNTGDFYYVGTTRVHRFFDEHEQTIWDQYIQCFFQVVCALGGNEVGPRTNLEIIVIWFILVFLVIYLAIIFGEMSLLVAMCTAKSTEFQEQIDIANTAMANIELSAHD